MNEWELLWVSVSCAIFIHYIFLSYIGSTLGLSQSCDEYHLLPTPDAFSTLLHFVCTQEMEVVSRNPFPGGLQPRPGPAGMKNTKAKVPVLLLSPGWLCAFLFYFVLFLGFASDHSSCQLFFLHSCMLQSAVADIPNSSRPRVGTALASNNPGPLYYPLLAPILQKPPLVAASQVLSLSEPSASC